MAPEKQRAPNRESFRFHQRSSRRNQTRKKFMEDKILTEYKGITISYDEQQNRWNFVLRNRDRIVPSLAEAKKLIDKPAPKDKKPFERVTCWRRSWSEGGSGKCWKLVDVTSVTTQKYHDEPFVWIVDQKTKEREKTPCDELYPCNPENDRLIDYLKALDVKTAEIKKLSDAGVKKLKGLVVEPEPGEKED